MYKNVILIFVMSFTTAFGQFNIIHSFTGTTGTPIGGDNPYGDLILDGTTLYGMTYEGGTENEGTIFTVETDGSGFTLLHSFGTTGDGDNPRGSLIQDGTTLYGMTQYGGGSNAGTIFKIETDGTGYSILHSFSGGSGGYQPYDSLILDGTTLYGMTYEDGGHFDGIIFKIDTDGSNFERIHSFNTPNGENPRGSLILDGTTLYGMTYIGGANNAGTIFKIETDGSGFDDFYHFSVSATVGRYPWGSLVIAGSTLYGLTDVGGANVEGTIFEINTDGTGFDLLHSFGTVTDGEYTSSSLVRHGTSIYGMTQLGGTGSSGTLFRIELDGTGYSILHSFAGNPGGYRPYGSVTLGATTIYGMTSEGGANNLGTIYSLEDISLPVELASFNVENTIEGVLCKWTTESEIENLGFMLERKTIGTDWQEIVSYKTDYGLMGQGSTSSATDYEYLDTFVEPNTTYEYRLADVDYDSFVTYHSVRTVTVEKTPLSSILEEFTVLPAYPNPFNPSTTITYGINEDSNVNILIYDITGQLITTLLNTEQLQGWHSMLWNGTNQQGEQVPAGIYLSKITSGSDVKTTKLMLLK